MAVRANEQGGVFVAIEMGVLRTSPLFRPRTESKCCDPILRPRRSIATFSRTIHIGGGFTSDIVNRLGAEGQVCEFTT